MNNQQNVILVAYANGDIAVLNIRMVGIVKNLQWANS